MWKPDKVNDLARKLHGKSEEMLSQVSDLLKQIKNKLKEDLTNSFTKNKEIDHDHPLDEHSDSEGEDNDNK